MIIKHINLIIPYVKNSKKKKYQKFIICQKTLNFVQTVFYQIKGQEYLLIKIIYVMHVFTLEINQKLIGLIEKKNLMNCYQNIEKKMDNLMLLFHQVEAKTALS